MFLHLLRGERLSYVAARTTRQCLHYMSLAPLCRNHDHGYILGVLDSGKLLDELQSVHYRHVDVTKDQVDFTVFENTQCLCSVPGLKYIGKIDPGLTERALHYLSHDRRIIDDERTYRHKVVITLRCGTRPRDLFLLRPPLIYRLAVPG